MESFDLPLIYFSFFCVTLVIGAFFGSFCSKMVYRLAAGRFRGWSVLSPSFCPVCGKRLKFSDKIPVYSYIALKGKCRRCGERILPRYLFFEIAGMLLPFFLYWYLNFMIAEVIIGYLFLMIMLTDLFICLDTKYPSDRLSFSLLILALIQAFYLKTSVSALFYSLAFGVFFFLLIQALYGWKIKRYDYIVFTGTLSLFFPDTSLLILGIIFVLFLTGIQVYNAIEHKERLYFGTLLCVSAMITFLFQEPLVELFENLIVFVIS